MNLISSCFIDGDSFSCCVMIWLIFGVMNLVQFVIIRCVIVLIVILVFSVLIVWIVRVGVVLVYNVIFVVVLGSGLVVYSLFVLIGDLLFLVGGNIDQ